MKIFPALAATFAVAALLAVPVAAFAQAAPSQSPKAPEFVGTTWLNLPEPSASEAAPGAGGTGRSFVAAVAPTLASRAGKVTLVAFWTFACSNCQANIEPYRRILANYRPKGVELISIHTPEIEIERKKEAVAQHIAKFKIDYPVLIDNNGENWNRWSNEVWPTLYVIDRKGRVRYRWVGELNYQNAGGEATVQRVIDRLLAEPN